MTSTRRNWTLLVALRRLAESRGPYGTLDLPGLVLAGAGAFGIVFGLVRSQSLAVEKQERAVAEAPLAMLAGEPA
jgi:hypothetical protein